jgi:nicotinate-nucleotide--dimethylbenzimidazole phosphoribosyltransferase
MQVNSLGEFRALLAELPMPDTAAMTAARARDRVLTKPPGALGRLEDLAIWYRGWQPTRAAIDPQIVVFAGNHGVTAQGVSAFPPDVTAQMVANFAAGGAAINQLAKCAGASMQVVALDLDRPTADFTQGPAMSDADLLAALNAGLGAVDPTAGVFVAGEMGIGNTTAAAALAAALFGGSPEDWVGRGTGVDNAGLIRKADAVRRGLLANPLALSDPLEALRALGGRELAAMCGAVLGARLARVPVFLDGFICTASAAVLERLKTGALDHAVAGHGSAEQAHQRLLAALGKAPLLDLGLRLGEGSGAALALPILQAALACHDGMATFGEAGVSEG